MEKEKYLQKLALKMFVIVLLWAEIKKSISKFKLKVNLDI